MRRAILVALSAALLATAWAAHGAADGSDLTAAAVAPANAEVVPAALVPCQRLDAGPGQLLGKPDPMEDPRGVRTDLDARADLAQRRRLLVHPHVEAGVQQRQRRAEPADAPPTTPTDPPLVPFWGEVLGLFDERP